MKLMDWKKCEKGFIRNVEVDSERINSIKEKALLRMNLIDSLVVDEKTVSFIVEGYYEVIKELLVAYLLQNGLRAKNHQCLISYFSRENPDLEHETMIIAKMSYYRNRLDYYGETIPTTFFDENKSEFKNIIKQLQLFTK
jgi:uncharacterized protein (UPF0332 family)